MPSEKRPPAQPAASRQVRSRLDAGPTLAPPAISKLTAQDSLESLRSTGSRESRALGHFDTTAPSAILTVSGLQIASLEQADDVVSEVGVISGGSPTESVSSSISDGIRAQRTAAYMALTGNAISAILSESNAEIELRTRERQNAGFADRDATRHVLEQQPTNPGISDSSSDSGSSTRSYPPNLPMERKFQNLKLQDLRTLEKKLHEMEESLVNIRKWWKDNMLRRDAGATELATIEKIMRTLRTQWELSKTNIDVQLTPEAAEDAKLQEELWERVYNIHQKARELLLDALSANDIKWKQHDKAYKDIRAEAKRIEQGARLGIVPRPSPPEGFNYGPEDIKKGIEETDWIPPQGIKWWFDCALSDLTYRGVEFRQRFTATEEDIVKVVEERDFYQDLKNDKERQDVSEVSSIITILKEELWKHHTNKSLLNQRIAVNDYMIDYFKQINFLLEDQKEIPPNYFNMVRAVLSIHSLYVESIESDLRKTIANKSLDHEDQVQIMHLVYKFLKAHNKVPFMETPNLDPRIEFTDNRIRHLGNFIYEEAKSFRKVADAARRILAQRENQKEKNKKIIYDDHLESQASAPLVFISYPWNQINTRREAEQVLDKIRPGTELTVGEYIRQYLVSPDIACHLNRPGCPRTFDHFFALLNSFIETAFTTLEVEAFLFICNYYRQLFTCDKQKKLVYPESFGWELVSEMPNSGPPRKIRRFVMPKGANVAEIMCNENRAYVVPLEEKTQWISKQEGEVGEEDIRPRTNRKMDEHELWFRTKAALQEKMPSDEEFKDVLCYWHFKGKMYSYIHDTKPKIPTPHDPKLGAALVRLDNGWSQDTSIPYPDRQENGWSAEQANTYPDLQETPRNGSYIMDLMRLPIFFHETMDYIKNFSPLTTEDGLWKIYQDCFKPWNIEPLALTKYGFHLALRLCTTKKSMFKIYRNGGLEVLREGWKDSTLGNHP